MTVYVLKDLTKKETNVFKVKNFNCRVVKIVDSHEKFMSTFCHILPMGGNRLVDSITSRSWRKERELLTRVV